MKKTFVSNVGANRTLKVLGALLRAVVLLVGCGGGGVPPNNSVDLAVVGQTVTKVRTSGNEAVLLEERLTSIFEDGPQRTLTILQSDGHTVQPYTPPAGWSVDDFAVHPSGDISAILTTATVCESFGSIQTARFEATNYFSTPPLQPIRSLTTPEGLSVTTLFSLR